MNTLLLLNYCHLAFSIVSKSAIKMDVLKTYQSKVISPDSLGLDRASTLLRQGKLVAFPTETVYGLGANALNEEAVNSIFVAKGRPLTDPLIVHIPNKESGRKLLDISKEEDIIYNSLADKFWPGPLTIIAKSAPCIPLSVTAQTGFVGVRCPSHPVALALLTRCGLPIAAPSANRFAHVSPTRAHHVLSDLGEKDIHVLTGDDSSFSESTCKYGIESTVLKISTMDRTLQIFRQGAVIRSELEALLVSHGLMDWKVNLVNRIIQPTSTSTSTTNKESDILTAVKGGDVAPAVKGGDVAPGQAVTHYSPDVPCYAVSSVSLSSLTSDAEMSVDSSKGVSVEVITPELLKSAVLIDFNGRLRDLYPYVLDCRDLSVTGDASEAARNLFDFLRWSEEVPGAARVYIPALQEVDQSVSDELLLGVADRVHRAASGRVLDLILGGTKSS